MMRKKTTLWLLAATVVTLGSVAFGLLYLSRDRNGSAAQADSLVTAARVSAVAARARATAAGIDPALMAGGDSVNSAAEAMADSGRATEAAALFAAAAAMWDSIPAGPARDPGPVESAPAVREERSQAPAPPAAVSDSAAIVSYYRELALGIQARQLGEVRRLLPNLDDFAADAWRRMFEDRDVEKIEANFLVLNVTRTEDLVHARVQESLVVTEKGKGTPRGRTFYATLSLGPQGWRQIREDKLR
jgi:hypothetical protein